LKKLHDLTEVYKEAKQKERLAKNRALLARSKIAKRDAEEDVEFWNNKATMLWTMINSPVIA
jgi:hypothetical protein